MSEHDDVTSGKRFSARSDKSSLKRSRPSRPFCHIHMRGVSKSTGAADVRKEAEKFGEVTDVIDLDLYTSKRNGIVSKSFKIKFAEPEDADHCLTSFCRYNIFGRKEIVVKVWKNQNIIVASTQLFILENRLYCFFMDEKLKNISAYFFYQKFFSRRNAMLMFSPIDTRNIDECRYA